MAPAPEWLANRRQHQSIRGNDNTLIGGDNNSKHYQSVVQNLTFGIEKALSTEVRLDHEALERIVKAKVDASVQEYESYLSQAEDEVARSDAAVADLTAKCGELEARVTKAEREAGSITGFLRSQARVVLGVLVAVCLIGLAAGFRLDREPRLATTPASSASGSAGSESAGSASATVSNSQSNADDLSARLGSEDAARAYLVQANQNEVNDMWTSATERFRADPDNGGYEGFADWWDTRVDSVEYIVSSGDLPAKDKVDPAARWVQVALRFTVLPKSGAARQESDYSLHWWRFVRGADGEYHLDDVREAQMATCAVDHVATCSRSNPPVA